VPVPVDPTGRPVAPRPVDLDRFFRPARVAVVGASDTPGRPNTGVWRRLLAWSGEVGAEVVPVNPTKDVVDGLPCVASLLDVPTAAGPIDVVAVLVSDAVPVVEQAIAAGAGFAVVFAAGFAEQGAEGRVVQEELGRIVAASELHLLGPNTNLNAFESFRTDLPGRKIALISQSGHQGRPIFQAQEIGIGLNHWAPTGNEVDLEFADFARWFADQPDTGVVAAYIEGFKDGRTLHLAADHAATAGVPIVCVKVGRTEAGASMASSHTGKLTGADAVVSAALRQFGVTRVDGLDEMLDVCQLMARHPDGPARGTDGEPAEGVVVYAISGGTGAHMADLVAAAGLDLPTLSDDLQATLHEWIPDFLRVSNPVDNGGHPVGDERGRKILDALVADPAVGVLVCPITGAFPPMSDKLAQDLVDVAETTDKPICVIWGSPVGTEAAYRDILLGSSKLAVFRTFAGCVTAVRAWRDWHRYQARHRSPFATPVLEPSPAAAVARPLVAGRDALSEHEAKAVLAAYGIPVTREQVVTSAADAVRAAQAIGGGGPVVLKASGAHLAHKSDVGGVRVGVVGDDAVARAYADLADISGGAGSGGEVLVAELVAEGVVETVVGLSQDPLFGPVVAVGLGGVLVEVLGDVGFLIPPFDGDDVRRVLDGLRGAPLLRGVRGRPTADVDALVDVVLAVQRLAVDLHGEVAELDVNPLVLRAAGGGAVALDALVVPRR
jgi:acetate---CoA ligase (ADP-forming)